MGQSTDISWTHHTYNPWWGCHKPSEGCKFCYAEGIAKRYGKQVWGPSSTTARWTFGAKHWQEPLKWNKKAQQEQERKRVFCASMADVYEDHPDVVSERLKLWSVIEQTPWLDWLLLTKRPENILNMSPWQRFPNNVWIGTSVESQKRAEERVPLLLQIPARVRFLSCEPLLGPVNLTAWLSGLQWIICGGESGSQARPMDITWARSLRDQCLEAGVPYHFKQIGGRYHDSGGRLLDGSTWDMSPQLTTA